MAAALLLAVMWATMPVQLHRADDHSSGEECLTLADRTPPPDPTSEIPLLERCANTISSDAELAADLGVAYAAAGRDADAERAYRRALEIDPDFGDVHLKLAEQLLKQGASTDAQSHVEAVLRIQPNRRAARELLAKVAAAK